MEVGQRPTSFGIFAFHTKYSYSLPKYRIRKMSRLRSDWRSAGGVDVADWEPWQVSPRLYYAPNNLHATLDTNRLIKHWASKFLFIISYFLMASGAFCILILLRESGWLQALVARSISWNQIGPMHSGAFPGFKESYRSFKCAPHQIHASQIWKSLANTKPETYKSVQWIWLIKGTFKGVSFGWS